MKLLNKAQRDMLARNGQHIAIDGDDDLQPVVKLFTPDANCTWLLVAIEPDFCLLYTSPSPRDRQKSRMPSSA